MSIFYVLHVKIFLFVKLYLFTCQNEKCTLRNMNKSPIKHHQKEEIQESFEDAVARLNKYMFYGEGDFKFSKIKKIDGDEPENNYVFENPVLTDILLDKASDNIKINNTKCEDASYKIDSINNAVQSSMKIDIKQRYNSQIIRDPNAIIDMIESNTQSKIVSDRLAKSRLSMKQNYMNDDMKYFNVVTDRQQLFKDREKFRQSQRK